ncbi:MAG TPA: hypothetical protein VNX68_01435 [Nitrosopumilaceae archaeon]|jgi:hypothetical protein|nr:hypothetical protein [Nitrosopumilaceae archaeon]
MSDKEVLQIGNIIEYPRKSNSPNQPEYESDVYNIPEVEAQNKRHMGYNGKPGKIIATTINFSARKNNRKE